MGSGDRRNRTSSAADGEVTRVNFANPSWMPFLIPLQVYVSFVVAPAGDQPAEAWCLVY